MLIQWQYLYIRRGKFWHRHTQEGTLPYEDGGRDGNAAVVQSPSCVRLFGNPMDCSMPGLPVLHYLPKFAQVHIHCILWCIQPSSDALSSCPPQSFPESGTFLMSWLFATGDQNTGVSASTSVLPKKIQGWFPLRLTGLISLLSKGLSGVFSSTHSEGINFLVFCLFHGPVLTTVHDFWEDHSLDYTDLCRQSNVSAFQHTV